MELLEIGSYRDFLNLKEDWNEVVQRSTQGIFSTWEWLSTWWKHFGIDRKLIVLLAKEGREILGIAPLMYSIHSMFGLRIGKIEFIGTPDSDYTDFILTNKSEECLKLFLDHIQRLPGNWKCVDLNDIPEESRSSPFLNRISKSLKPVHKCPYLLLPKSYETFLKNSLKRNQRKYIYRNERNLEKDFRVELVDCSDIQSFAGGMRRLFYLHQKRWESRGFAGAFSNEKFRDFHLDIAESFSRRGWLGLHLLSASGTIVSANYGFKYQSKYQSYLAGFDPEYGRYSVGNLLHAYSIQKSITEGLTEYDFMRGAEEYKGRWNTMTRWNNQAIVTRKGFLENTKYQLYDNYWQQGSRLKYILKNAPKTLAHRLNK